MQQAVLSHSMFLTSIESLEAYTEEHSVTPCTFSLLSRQPFFRSVTFCTACNNTPTRNCATFNKNDTLCIQTHTSADAWTNRQESAHSHCWWIGRPFVILCCGSWCVCVHVQCITYSDIICMLFTHICLHLLCFAHSHSHLLHRWFRPRSGKWKLVRKNRRP